MEDFISYNEKQDVVFYKEEQDEWLKEAYQKRINSSEARFIFKKLVKNFIKKGHCRLYFRKDKDPQNGLVIMGEYYFTVYLNPKPFLGVLIHEVGHIYNSEKNRYSIGIHNNALKKCMIKMFNFLQSIKG